ncbi:MAG: ABC transporter permease [Acidimicrobiia bacterium]
MFRLTLKSLLANKVRFALTTFGVMLAVSFVVSAFVLGDGLRSSFTRVSEEVTAGVDLEVRNVADFGDTPPLAIDTVSTVAAVDGVADAVASIEAADDAVRPIKADGASITTDGPPQLAFNWIDNEELSPFTLVDGAPPQIGEFTMDVDSAAEHDFVIGDTYEVMVPGGRVELTLSGTSSFGADNSTLGAVLMQMNTAQASELFGIDGINSVAVQVADGADVADVRAAVAAAVPTAEVVDNATVLEETTTEFTDEINIVGNILLGFGGVALFVSIFIIYNTFAIVLGQRTRELALLRTVGADPKQIRRSVLGEALVVGVLASGGGIGGGIAVAKGIDALFGVMGVDLTEYPLILATRTLVAAAVIGVGVTMLAAIGPARRAATVPPIAVLTGGADAGAAGSRTRKIAGFGLFGAGLAAGAAGLSGIGSTAVTVAGLAFGAIAIFVGVTVLSPLAVRGVTGLFGWPMRMLAGVAGRLAQKNAARNSRRTATTAAALMIGLALVTTALVVGASVKATIGSTFEQSAKADYYLTDDLEEVEFPATLASEISDSDVVAAATGFTQFEARVDGTVTDVVGLDFDQIDAVLDLDVQAGGFDRNAVNPVVVSVDEANAIGAGVGDVLGIEVANGSRVETTVVGLFDDQAILTEDYVLDTSVLAAAGITPAPAWLAISIADGASPADVDTLVARLSAEYPYASVETAAEFRQRIDGMIDGVLTMVNVMVALAVIIALIGIANTLALSVFERTRELGLVRAVGMTRRQLRRMVRFEAALVATFGATLGVGLGLLFGFGVVTALPAAFASELSVPILQIVVVMLVAAGAGVAAAWLPARRAGRLDVLDAIAL